MKKFIKGIKKGCNNYIDWVMEDWYGVVTYWLACVGIGCIIGYIIKAFKKIRGN